MVAAICPTGAAGRASRMFMLACIHPSLALARTRKASEPQIALRRALALLHGVKLLDRAKDPALQ